ncbi:MAG: DUF1501 domain-containing protein, partial [Planctomycetota bacterium]|nr:DUF1501 domain-containing protein [Planctomycetota bacterium]
ISQQLGPKNGLPPYVAVPNTFPSYGAGYLGGAHNPFIAGDPNATGYQVRDLTLPVDVDWARVDNRRFLVQQMDARFRSVEASPDFAALDEFSKKAYDLLSSPTAKKAFDVQSEPAALRERYGRTPFGQGCLLARRLVERGAPLVTVNWERDDAYWDTHAKNFIDLKGKLCPNLDQGFSTLLDDLKQRGLLDDTLIVWLGEFGRTPQINANAGRDHWAACNTVLLAGAGIAGGAVYGSSDRLAAYPASNAVTPDDLAATVYHLLGIDREQTLYDPLRRPWPLCQGEPVWDIIG